MLKQSITRFQIEALKWLLVVFISLSLAWLGLFIQ